MLQNAFNAQNIILRFVDKHEHDDYSKANKNEHFLRW